MGILLDAGPSLNFLAVGQYNVLIQVAATNGLTLAVPRRVDSEIVGMCKDARFNRTAAPRAWGNLKGAGRVAVLPDDLTRTTFAQAVTRIGDMNAAQRVKQLKSLGEIMVLAHASVLVQQGQSVFVLMDEGDGRRRAGLEHDWLQRQGAPGQLRLWTTRQVLRAAHPASFKNGLTWEAVYKQMLPFDDGLVPL